MIGRFDDWINRVNTTSFRIVMSVITTSVGVVMVLVAVMFFDWQPKPVQITVLTGLAGVVLTMMGFDVLQYVGKRFSDRALAAAKAGPTVQVDQAGVVTAGTPGGSEPSAAAGEVPPAVTPLLHREPEHGDDA